MDVKKVVFLGTAAVVTAAAVTIGVLTTRNNPEQATKPEEAVTSEVVDEDMELIKKYEADRKQLLDELVFYKGNATVQEITKAVFAPGTVDPPADGSCAMVSEDVMVFDPRTGKCYLVARRISAIGTFIKDVVDMRGAYQGTANIRAAGILTEYYGTGVVVEKDPAQALEGGGAYFMSYASNPVRMDVDNEIIYTNPPVKNTYWTQLVDPEAVMMIAPPIFMPEELPVVDVALIPGLSQVSGSKTYNQKETMIFDIMGGKMIPQGTFEYKYTKTTYDEVRDFLEELKAEAYKDTVLDEAAKNLVDPWQDAVSIADGFGDIQQAAVDLNKMAVAFIPQDSADQSASRQAAAVVGAGEEYRMELDRSRDALDASDGTMRKLEDFSLGEGSSQGEKQAIEALRGLVPVLKDYAAKYRLALEELTTAVKTVNNYSDGKGQPEEIAAALAQVMKGAENLNQMGSLLETMRSELYGAVLTLDNKAADEQTQFEALAGLYSGWTETLNGGLSGTLPAVDLEDGVVVPEEYPEQIVPLLKDGQAVIYETMADGSIALTMKSNLSVEEIRTYYEAALAHLANLELFEMGEMVTFSGETQGYQISVIATQNQMGGDEKSMVQVMIVPMEE